METLLKVEHLSFAYDEDRPILTDVSFSLDEGSYIALIGHNGSGKSTLAKCLVGLLSPNGGSIEAFGIGLERKTLVEIRSRIGIVFQNPDNQFVGSTVADDIAFGLENKCVESSKMQQIIEEFASEAGMLNFLAHEPQNLSGGQKQRVAIAGVLAMNPDIVIFDEATAMLDPKGRREIRELIAKMRKRNPKLTLLSITHDVEEAAMADKVIVLNEGKIMLNGTPNEVFSHQKELNEIHLDIPFAYALKNALSENGVSVPETINDLVSLEDYLCR